MAFELLNNSYVEYVHVLSIFIDKIYDIFIYCFACPRTNIVRPDIRALWDVLLSELEK